MVKILTAAEICIKGPSNDLLILMAMLERLSHYTLLHGIWEDLAGGDHRRSDLIQPIHDFVPLPTRSRPPAPTSWP